VYGTLRPGHAPPAIAAVVATLRSVAPARLRGRLYDLGPYTGAVFDPSAPDFVHGEVVETGPDSPPLAWFDAYEGDEFRRERHEVETASGGRLTCWSYALAHEPEPERSGRRR
jgi:gamma-glutamylcyclotransferase (GGCT)/AIG2-like uncharacterized protein YtfP